MAEAKAKNKGGCPPKYADLGEFKAKVDEFIAYCEDNDIDATDYQLTKFFGISPSTLDRYRASDNPDSDAKGKDISTYKGFGAALKKIDLYREDATIRQAKANPKLSGHAAFKLKQPHWGGWTDKQVSESAGEHKIDITINGI